MSSDRFVDKFLKVVPEHKTWVHEDTQYPCTIFDTYTDAELNSIGIYRVNYINLDIPKDNFISSHDYSWEDGVVTATPVFSPIPIIVPQSVTKAQGKAALALNGKLEEVMLYIDSLQDTNKTLALIAFNESNNWDRNSKFLSQVAEVLQLSEQDVDNLFIQANDILL